MNITRRELIKKGMMGAAGLGIMGAVDLGMFVRRAVAAGQMPFDGIKNLAAPLFGSPAMLKTGGMVDIALKAEGSALSSAALVSLDGKEFSLNAEKSGSAWTAPLPADAAPGIYHLKISSSNGSGEAISEVQPRAVAVYGEFKDDFDFVFISDIHFGEHDGKFDQIVTPEMTQYYTMRALALQEVERRKPEFIVFGGDMVLYPKNYRFGYPESYAFLLNYLKSPVHMMPGNHDLYHMEVEELGGEHVYGMKYWEKYYGKLYHAFDYGNLHIPCVNTTDWPEEFIHWGSQNTTTGTLLSVGIQKEQFNWLQGNLTAAKARGAEAVVCGHIPFHNIVSGMKVGLPAQKLPGAPAKAILGLLSDNDVRNLFVGHLHMNKVQDLGGGIQENMIRNVGGDFFDSDNGGFAVVHVRGGKVDGYELVELTI